MTRLMSRLAFVVVLGAPGCSSGGGRCEGDLAQIRFGCPQTFDGTAAQIPACPAYAVTYAVQLCGDLIRFRQIGLVGGSSCYYDASSHQLVGAAEGTDIATYCGGTSAERSAGRVADSCTSEPVATKDCETPP
jgi:hypothetical protein